jgi:acyl-CoA thioesterase-1
MCGLLAACVALFALASVAGAAPARPTILVIGDSLSAAYGIAVEEGWVALLERRLREEGYEYAVVNASVSGDTSRGAVARLPRLLDAHAPALVVIEIGGNDGLRGLPVAELRANLARMIEAAQAAGARVLLLGMRIPPNYGLRYTEEFADTYATLAERYDTALVPFILEGIALDETLMQGDGIHPRADAQPLIRDRVWERLAPLLKDMRGRAPARATETAPARD